MGTQKVIVEFEVSALTQTQMLQSIRMLESLSRYAAIAVNDVTPCTVVDVITPTVVGEELLDVPAQEIQPDFMYFLTAKNQVLAPLSGKTMEEATKEAQTLMFKGEAGYVWEVTRRTAIGKKKKLDSV